MLTVLAPGPLATVQDHGRPGWAAIGVPTSGAADRASHDLANRLVGNDPAAATVEVTAGGLRVQADRTVLVAVTGAPAPVTVDGQAAPFAAPFSLSPEAVLSLGMPPVGLRSYLAVRGGVAVPPVLDSRSTDTLSGVTVHSAEVSTAQASAANQSRRGPGSTSRTGRDDGGRTGATSTTGSSPARVPTGRTAPAASGAGPSPDSVSVLRESSTGGTATPPRTAR